MPVITISKIADRTKTSAKGKKYKVVSVEGTKYGSDETWTTDIFANKNELLDMLNEFGPGDTANFKFVKNGNFYDLTEIVEPTEENLEYAAENSSPRKSTGGKPASSGGGGGGAKAGTMSKGEWAEKDRLTNIRIAKAVAIKLACDNTKAGTNIDALIEMAEELVPWLLDTNIAQPEPKGNDDPLDPPVED